MIPIPIPPSVNHLWRIVRRRSRTRGDRSTIARSEQYEAWLFEVSQLMREGLQKATLPARIFILIRGGEGWHPTRDLDNTLKATMDALVMAKRIPSDSTKCVHEVRVRYLEPIPGLRACCQVGYLEDRD